MILAIGLMPCDIALFVLVNSMNDVLLLVRSGKLYLLFVSKAKVLISLYIKSLKTIEQ